MNKLDIIVPVLNEAKSLPELLTRLANSLNESKITYGIIVVDDHSTDKTKAILRQLSKLYPITFVSKHGETGKAYSLLEGIIKHTLYRTVLASIRN